METTAAPMGIHLSEAASAGLSRKVTRMGEGDPGARARNAPTLIHKHTRRQAYNTPTYKPQTHKHRDTHTQRHVANTQTHIHVYTQRYTNIPTNKRANAQPHTNTTTNTPTPTHTNTNMQILKHTNKQTYTHRQHINTLADIHTQTTYKHTSRHTHPHTSTPAQTCTLMHLRTHSIHGFIHIHIYTYRDVHTYTLAHLQKARSPTQRTNTRSHNTHIHGHSQYSPYPRTSSPHRPSGTH